MEISTKEMGGESDATIDAGTIKLMIRSTVRKRNYTSVVKKDIQRLIIKRLKYKENDDKSTRSTLSRAIVKKIEKYVKKISREITTVNTQLKI